MKKKGRKERAVTMRGSYCHLYFRTPHTFHDATLFFGVINHIYNTFLYEHLFLWEIVLGESHDH